MLGQLVNALPVGFPKELTALIHLYYDFFPTAKRMLRMCIRTTLGFTVSLLVDMNAVACAYCAKIEELAEILYRDMRNENQACAKRAERLTTLFLSDVTEVWQETDDVRQCTYVTAPALTHWLQLPNLNDMDHFHKFRCACEVLDDCACCNGVFEEAANPNVVHINPLHIQKRYRSSYMKYFSLYNNVFTA